MKRVTAALLVAFCPAWAFAQGPATDSIENARAYLGPLGIAPSMTVSTLLDSNVFYDTDRPRRDVMVTAAPAARAWLRMGRSQIRFDGQGYFVYFRRYSGEGSLDGSMAAQYLLRANRVTPWVEGRVARGRQRVSYDIDARVDHGERARAGGLDVRVLAKTSAGLYGGATDYWYGDDATFVGTDLRQALNRRSTTIGARVTHALTPLTSLVMQGETIRDRFDFSSARDSNSMRVLAGVALDSAALIPGRARIGYRRFETREGRSSFRGVVGSLDAAVTVGGRVRLAFDALRDLEYSYDLASPYYVRTGGQLTAVGRLTPHWELVGRAGRHHLSYHDGFGTITRVDRIETYGSGVGFRVGTTLRIGMNVDRERRLSATGGRGFDGYRLGAAVTFGG